MESKYQEAKDKVSEYINNHHCQNSDYEMIPYLDTLQELIDNYEEQVRYKDLSALEHKKNQKIEKALDKAIDDIDKFTGSCPNDMYDKDYDCKNICHDQYHECWKKYYLEESEKQ